MCRCSGCYICWQIWGGGKLSSYMLNRKIQETLWSNVWFCSWRILRLKNCRQLSLLQMEGDTVSIPKDGGPGHVIQGLLSGDKKPGGIPLAACPPPCSPQQRPSKCMGQGRTTSHVSPPFPGVPLSSCWAGSQVASNQRKEVAPTCLGVPESKHPLLDPTPCLWE